jgi:hypothetical protein
MARRSPWIGLLRGNLPAMIDFEQCHRPRAAIPTLSETVQAPWGSEPSENQQEDDVHERAMIGSEWQPAP